MASDLISKPGEMLSIARKYEAVDPEKARAIYARLIEQYPKSGIEEIARLRLGYLPDHLEQVSVFRDSEEVNDLVALSANIPLADGTTESNQISTQCSFTGCGRINEPGVIYCVKCGRKLGNFNTNKTESENKISYSTSKFIRKILFLLFLSILLPFSITSLTDRIVPIHISVNYFFLFLNYLFLFIWPWMLGAFYYNSESEHRSQNRTAGTLCLLFFFAFVGIHIYFLTYLDPAEINSLYGKELFEIPLYRYGVYLDVTFILFILYSAMHYIISQKSTKIINILCMVYFLIYSILLITMVVQYVEAGISYPLGYEILFFGTTFKLFIASLLHSVVDVNFETNSAADDS